jgi:hypothetical protein
MIGHLGTRERIAAVAALLVLACSSSSKTRANEICNPGEVEACQLPSGCEARTTCNPDGKSYGSCHCVGDGGASGGSSGTNASGGSSGGGVSGAGGTSGGPGGVGPGGDGGTSGGPAGAAGSPPTGGTGPGGTAGAPPTGGNAGSGGAAGSGGSAGGSPTGGASGDSGACLRCRPALLLGVAPTDPRLCMQTRDLYPQAYECTCGATSVCKPPCSPHCTDPANYAFSPGCQSCFASSCGPIAAACQSD